MDDGEAFERDAKALSDKRDTLKKEMEKRLKSKRRQRPTHMHKGRRTDVKVRYG